MSIESAVEAGRRLVATTLLDSCRIERRTPVDDGAGGHTFAWLPVATVACRFGVIVDQHPVTAVETMFAPPTAPLLLPLGTDVLEQDRVINLGDDGKAWVVIGDKTPPSALAVTTRVTIRRLD